MPKRSQKALKQKPVLIVQHAPHEHPAVVRRALEAQGIATRWIHSYQGQEYPKLGEIRGMISLGGPMNANQELEHPWIKTEVELLRQCTESNLPVAGICLGGQLLARAMGGRVEKNDIAEVGWFPIELNAEGKKDPLLGPAGSNPVVYHWHHDTFFLPKSAVPLAASQACPRQAYRIGTHAYGFQFHPEADHQLVQEWMCIEGVENEIEETQSKHGTSTVQCKNTQISHGLKGEKASLKITAGIGQLFKDHAYDPANCDEHDTLEEWATLRSPLILELIGSNGKIFKLRGTISTILTIQSGEFLIFREENSLLWPIRMDFIRQIKPISKK